jgi:hypothetical protein
LRSLIDGNLNSKLNDIVKTLFQGNRIFDRGMSVLTIKFNLQKTVSMIHPRLAHLYPKLADVISDYQADRDTETIYGLTPLDESDYNVPLEFFEKVLEYQENLESLVTEVIDESNSSGDKTTKVFLEKFLLDLIPVTAQLLLLVDKCEAYGDQMQLFDSNVEDFITLPL